MSTTPPPSPPDDPLARAEAALRKAPIPEGPSEEVITRTLAALQAAGGPGTIPHRRRKIMLATIKIAATALMAATAGLLYFANAPEANATTAFAEMAQKLRDAHTLTYRMTMDIPGGIKAPAALFFFKEPGLARTEMEGGIISIVDMGRGQQLMLDPKAKTALRIESEAGKAPATPAIGLIENLKALTEGDARPAGEEQVGDVRARGYRIEKFGQEMTIWADPATRLPVRIESAGKVDGKEFRAIITDFRIDPEIDDALFRMDPPEGYAVREMQSDMFSMDEKTFADPEKATVALLRIFAEKAGGRFPKDLKDYSEFDKAFPKGQKAGALPDPESFKAIQALARFMMATRTLKGGFGYHPEGVKLGDADKILFWYTPEGASRPRAIYGDLHAADVDAGRLPERPKP